MGREAAEQGQAEAQMLLAERYFKGEGVPKDDAEVVKWGREAAEQGQAEAQFSLGGLYAQGALGVSQDIVEAHKWLSLVATQGHEKASEGRDKLAREMTPDQIAEAEQRAREWTKK